MQASDNYYPSIYEMAASRLGPEPTVEEAADIALYKGRCLLGRLREQIADRDEKIKHFHALSAIVEWTHEAITKNIELARKNQLGL